MRLKNYIKKYFDFKRIRKSRHKKYKCPIVEDYGNECRNIPKVEDPSKVYDAM